MARSLFIFLFIAHYAIAQPKQDGCIGKLMAIYERFDQLNNNLDAGRQVRYQFVSEVVMKDSLHVPVRRTQVELITGRKKMQTISADARVFLDENNSFTIIPSRKVIYWANGNKGGVGQGPENSVLTRQDSLLHSAKVLACIQSPSGLHIILGSDERSKRKFPYERLSFVIDPDKKTFRKIEVIYRAAARFHRITYSFREIEVQQKSADFSQPAYDQVFAGDQKLRSQYSSYQLLDIRRKTIKKSR